MLFDEEQLRIVADQSEVHKDRPKDECLLCRFHVARDPDMQNEDHQSIIETVNKKLKTGTELAASSTSFIPNSNGRPDDTEHDYMALHISSHLQTLMFLSLRVISIRRDAELEQDETAKSDAITIDSKDCPVICNPPDPVVFSDEGPPTTSAWIPATEGYTMQYLRGIVQIYPKLEFNNLIDPELPDAPIPDSEAIEDMIIRLEVLLGTTEQHRLFYESNRKRIKISTLYSLWECAKCGGENIFPLGKQCQNFPCQAHFNDKCRVYSIPIQWSQSQL